MFGIIVGCCPSDWHYAVGTYASIRHYLGDIPVCFLYDGAQVPGALQGLPGAQMLSRQMVRHPELQRRSFGPGLTKMVSFWESPFEEFLYLDADTVVCGDVAGLADFSVYDALVDHRSSYDDEAINKWFLDTERIARCVNDFDYQKHREDYFCTGTFFARKNLFPIEEYLEFLTLSEQEPGLFKFWEMGLLNVMIFRNADLGRIRVKRIPYQLVATDHPYSELQKLFESSLKRPHARGTAPSVFHFVVHKPHLFQKQAFTAPMCHFRMDFWTRHYGLPRVAAWAVCLWQDIRRHWLREARYQLWLVKRWLQKSVSRPFSQRAGV